MNDHDTDLDPEQMLDASNVSQPSALGIEHSFKGNVLENYTFSHRMLVNRLTQDSMSGAEYAALVIYACTKTRKEVSAIRSAEQLEAFHIEAEEWADKQGMVSREVTTEAIKVASEILKAVDEANNWIPEAPPGVKSEPGNEPGLATRPNTSPKSPES